MAPGRKTPLTTPLQLQAGVTYRVGIYFTSQTRYYRSTAPVNPTFATLGQTYDTLGDGFPTTADSFWWMVDLRGDASGYALVPVTPTLTTFISGVWSGAISVTQGINGMFLRVADGAGHFADSNTFNTLVQTLTVALPRT